MDNADILTIFRLVAPEFSEVDNSEIMLQIDFCKDFVSERKFGKFYGKAVSYYVAHLLKIYAIADENGSESGIITTNGVVMEKEGDLQRQYSTSENSDISVDMLKKTMYGKLFLQLRSMCIVPVLTRMG